MQNDEANSSATDKAEPVAQVGDLVQAIAIIRDEGREVAVPGDTGWVEYTEEGQWPTVFWERTKRTTDCVPGQEVQVLAEAGFASSEATTPHRTRRAFLRRGLN